MVVVVVRWVLRRVLPFVVVVVVVVAMTYHRVVVVVMVVVRGKVMIHFLTRFLVLILNPGQT